MSDNNEDTKDTDKSQPIKVDNSNASSTDSTKKDTSPPAKFKTDNLLNFSLGEASKNKDQKNNLEESSKNKQKDGD